MCVLVYFSKSSVCFLILNTVITLSYCQAQIKNIASGHTGKLLVLRSNVGSDTCSTPSAKSGQCIPLIRCRRFWGRSNIPDLGHCPAESTPRVCCPLAEEEENNTESILKDDANSTTVEPPTMAPDVNSTDRARRGGSSVFPSDCGRSGASFSRIIGGRKSVLGAWPWMAVLYLIRRGARSAECGGALITSSHVLTAAHCIVTSRRGNTLNPSQLLVRLGDLDLESDHDGASPLDVKIRNIIKHERFNLRNFQNDIAILELEHAVPTSSMISPICLPFDTFFEEELGDRNAIAAGWGSTRFGGPGSDSLQEVQLRIWKNSECQEVFRRDVPITIANLCAGDGDTDACRGDSGGPLMLPDERNRFYLIGLVSFGRKCAEPGIPGVYARVTTFLDWIEEKIG